MKTKNQNSKLFLKKQTIANLRNLEMNMAKGGTEESSACISIKICPQESHPYCEPASPVCATTTP